MELIIKPTEACNFKCTFCSSTDIAPDKSAKLELEKIFEFLKRFPETNTIIINGGDPTMMPPLYYWEIINFLDHHMMDTTIAITTNLWDFYKNPDKWTPLFNNWRVGVTTSFQYGPGRLKPDGSLFSEEDFQKVSDLMLERVGYRPDFISVITDENDGYAIENVRLAKRMDVECKLNYAMASGVQSKPYILGKAYQLYIKVFEEGLGKWEFNTKQMVKRLKGKHTLCPQTRDCDEHIRVLHPDGKYFSCGSIADDGTHTIDFSEEMSSEKVATPLRDDFNLLSLKQECLTCPLFKICNGCKKTIKDLKHHDLVDKHCGIMKQIEKEVIALNRGDNEILENPSGNISQDESDKDRH